jgi:phosphatidate cytidylyltransferase
MGPLMILFVLGVFLLDEILEGERLPESFRALGLSTVPAGVAIFPVLVGIAFLGARELATIVTSKAIAASKRVMTFAAVLGLLIAAFVPDHIPGGAGAAVISMSAAAVLAFAMVYYARNRSVQGIVAAAGCALLAFVYLGLMFGALVAIRREHSAWVLFWVLLVTKSCDIGAYFTGRAIGRHKLIPWLSPGKTWEGLIGGLLFATLISYLGSLLLIRTLGLTDVPLYLMLIPGFLFGAVGQAGDLMESVFKRDAALKDSGATVPGMGGVLDVLDSVLLVCPLAYWWLRILSTHGYFVQPPPPPL